MAKQQLKPNANELWLYFQSVISWVKAKVAVPARYMPHFKAGKELRERVDNG